MRMYEPTLYLDEASNTSEFLKGPLVVTEKLDGYNGAIVLGNKFPRLQKRKGWIGNKEKVDVYQRFKAWFEHSYKNDINWELLHPCYIYGEIMFVRNEIHYTELPSWFIVFDVWDGTQYLHPRAYKVFCNMLELNTVPIIAELKNATIDKLYSYIPKVSNYGHEPAEGIVVSNYITQQRFKLVRNKKITEDPPVCSMKFNALAGGLL